MLSDEHSKRLLTSDTYLTGLNVAGGTIGFGEDKASDSVESDAADARSGTRGEKRDVRGLRLTQQPGEPSSSASLSASGGPWSGYLPAKPQDLTQIGQNAGEPFAKGLTGCCDLQPIAAIRMSLTLAAVHARSSCRSSTDWAVWGGRW